MKSIGVTTIAICTWFAAVAQAQSPPGDFDFVVNFPNPVIPSVVGPGDGTGIGLSGQSVQYNMNPGSVGGNDVHNLAGFLELNLLGGQFGDRLTLSDTSRLNLISGSIGNALFSNGEVNVTSGLIGTGFTLGPASQLNLTSGTIGRELSTSGEVNFTGGRVGTGFGADATSLVNITGGDFRLSSAAIAFGDHDLAGGPFLLSGILEDGTPFVFTDVQGDALNSISLIDANLPAANTAPFEISAASSLAAIRPEQTVTLAAGGSLPNDAAILHADLAIDGGNLGARTEIVGSGVNMSAGSIGSGSHLLGPSVVTATGGTIRSGFRIYRDARLDLDDQAVVEGVMLLEGGRVNMSGGALQFAELNQGATLDMSGGLSQSLNANSGGVINYSGGTIEGLNLGGGAVMNVHGGVLGGTGGTFFASLNSGTTINLHDGIMGANVQIRDGVTTNVLGGEIADNAIAVGGEINLHAGSIGSNFTLQSTELNMAAGTVDSNLIVDFQAIANISGGVVQAGLRVMEGGELNLTGGSLASLNLEGGEANIFGGSVPQFLNATERSSLNLIGSEFILDDFVQLELLETNRPFEITARSGTLSGILSDGSPFTLNLSSSFSTEATLNIIRADDMLAGDFDLDGDVDGRDFLVWQRDTTVGNLSDWQANYGVSSSTPTAMSVPEPAGVPMALLGCSLLLGRGLVLRAPTDRSAMCCVVKG